MHTCVYIFSHILTHIYTQSHTHLYAQPNPCLHAHVHTHFTWSVRCLPEGYIYFHSHLLLSLQPQWSNSVRRVPLHTRNCTRFSLYTIPKAHKKPTGRILRSHFTDVVTGQVKDLPLAGGRVSERNTSASYHEVTTAIITEVWSSK